MANLKCPCCKKDVLGRQKNYCSHECRETTKTIKRTLIRHKAKALKPKAKCLNCDNYLSGMRTKYCSDICCAKYEASHRVVKKEQQAASNKRSLKKALTIKLKLIKLLGGSCESCGYCKNSAALCFHHKNPATKLFQVDGTHCSHTEWQKLLDEANKCSLLCHNCHMELHHPHRSIDPEV